MENVASASASGAATASFVGCPDVVRILVVDEDPICLTTLAQMLQRYGYEVTAMASPEGALREVRQTPEGSFDLVLAAAHTQGTGMDGFALLKRLNDRLPVILFSGDDEPFETRLRAFQGGACDFLATPLDDNQVCNIWTHVARRRLTAATASDPRATGPARVARDSAAGEGSSDPRARGPARVARDAAGEGSSDPRARGPARVARDAAGEGSSDPRARGPARVARDSAGEESSRSRGIRQKKKQKQCRTTKKTNSNPLPSHSQLHASFVEAAEMLRGTEGYCPRGIRELLVAQDVKITIEQATIQLEIYERDCLAKDLEARPMAISPHYNNSKNYPTPGGSGSYIRSQGATNIDQTSLLINDAPPVGGGALGNESYGAGHVGHLHNNAGNHHGNPTCYGIHSNFSGQYGNAYGHPHGNGNGNCNGYCANNNFYHVGVPANGSMVSAPPSSYYYNLAHQVEQAVPTTTGLFPSPTRQQEFPQASRLSYNSATGGISMSPWDVPVDGDADLLRSYLAGKEVMLNTAATGMTSLGGMHGGGDAGQSSSSHPRDLTGIFSWETTNGNGTAGTSGGSRGTMTDGMGCDPSEDQI